MLRKTIALTLLFTAAAAVQADEGRDKPAAAPARTADTVVVSKVDMRGKPPYRRTFERLPVTEAARMEMAPRAEPREPFAPVSRRPVIQRMK